MFSTLQGRTFAKQVGLGEQVMSVLFVAIPIALAISLVAVVTFIRLVQTGQYDDLETPPRRMLFDESK